MRAHNPVFRFSQSKLFKQLTKSNPIVLADVGARGGIHSKWNLPGESIRVLGFEPDLEECKRLNEKSGKNHTYFPIALYNIKGTIELNVGQNPATSSIYLPNFPLWNRFPNTHELEVIKSIQVNCDTLDNVLASNDIHDVDFLKIDTQGSELQILEGARETLKSSIFGVDVEVEFSPVYKDQPLFPDVDKYLRDLGFVLFDMDLARLKRKKYGKFYSKGQVLWAHALYFRDFISNKEGSYKDIIINSEKAIKTVAIAELHGFSDFALELLDFYNRRRIIEPDVYKNIKGMIVKNIPSSEYRLLKNIRSAIGEYLWERMLLK